MPRPILALAVALAAALSLTPSLRAEADLDWDPERTWVFAVGLLEWEHSDIYASFPECMKDRRDEQLVETLRDAGVPDEQITYLQDKEATKANIRKAFRELLDETDEGDLLIFYFCGHGSRDADSGEVWFANYDAGEDDDSAWNVRDILKTIRNHFSGERALMLADCCHSGALYDQCRCLNLEGSEDEPYYAALTSSYSHNTSTGNWTYSDALLAGFRGEGQVDLNYDGVIELNELAQYTDLELAFLEGQKSMFTADPDFPRAAKLAEVEDESVPRVGQRIEVESKGQWYRATIIDVDGDQVEVHYAGFDDNFNEWVGPERTRPYQPAQFAKGDKVEVKWQQDGKWYPATVKDAWYGLHFVHYDDDDATNDEWVGPQSIRLRTE